MPTEEQLDALWDLQNSLRAACQEARTAGFDALAMDLDRKLSWVEIQMECVA
jgi:hypothetical protein